VQLFRLRNKRRCHAERRRHPESPVEFRSRPLHITLGKMRDPGRLTRIAYEQACLTRHSLKRNAQHAALVRTASPPRPPPSSPPDPRKAVSRCRRATRGRQQLSAFSGRSKPSRRCCYKKTRNVCCYQKCFNFRPSLITRRRGNDSQQRNRARGTPHPHPQRRGHRWRELADSRPRPTNYAKV
jgi:hypothetical protein